ncbi:hypothetical protein V6N13_106959 [Hibiscus sabdariffa]
MTSICRRTLWRSFKDRWYSKKRKLEKQNPNWSDLPSEIVERIIGRLRWVDRIWIRAVCKVWSTPNCHIPAIDKVPWAMKHICWRPTDNGQIFCLCNLFDPISEDYITERSLREEEFPFPFFADPCASACGWVLFSMYNIEQSQTSLFLYSMLQERYAYGYVSGYASTQPTSVPATGQALLFTDASTWNFIQSPRCAKQDTRLPLTIPNNQGSTSIGNFQQ